MYLGVVDEVNALRHDLSRMVAEKRDDVVDGSLVRQATHPHAVAPPSGRYQLRRQRRQQAVQRRQSQHRQLGAGTRPTIAAWIHVAIQHLQRTSLVTG